MGALLVMGAILAVGGFIALALSNEGRTAFPAFLTCLTGGIVLTVAVAGRMLGLL